MMQHKGYTGKVEFDAKFRAPDMAQFPMQQKEP
jgi:hypothetical protein